MVLAIIIQYFFLVIFKKNRILSRFFLLNNKKVELMKISYKWLRRYIDTELSIDELSKILTDIGLEVEGVERIETIKGGLEGVVIGEVLTCGAHPDSDHLNITTVNYGEGAVQIVCGAPNVAAGQKVVVATVGAVLYPKAEEEGIKIKKGKIRGVESLGMICAEDEIGVGRSHEGIMILSDDAVVGTPAKKYFGVEEDYMLEIGLTPNRIDAASHYGVARDLAAYLTYMKIPHRLSLPSVDGFTVSNDSRHIPIEVLNSESCPHYMGITVSGVTIAPSPQWLQDSLRAIGINPHNNVVDITNYILHEIGQPLHAFDVDKIKGGKVVVRNCVEGTKFKTLDEVERTLSGEDLMICSAVEPMCLAGVFGGMESGISSTTTSIFIESAYFNPVSIRKSAKRHGLNTDASFRYERGTDPNILPYALKRAATLMCELAGGEVTSHIVDVKSCEVEDFKVELSIDNCNKLIGKEIGLDNIKSILTGLAIKIVAERGDILSLLVPPYRVDVQREVDVIEDILRIYGYNNIEIPQSVHSTLSYAKNPDPDRVRNVVSNFLSALGCNEIMSNSLTKASYYEQCESYPVDKCVRIVNPLSADLNVMRQTLFFNAMEAIELNTNRKNGDLQMYEFGNCYFYNSEANREKNALYSYREESHCAITVTGRDGAASWNRQATQSSFYTLKSMAEKVLKRFGLDLNDAVYSACESDIYSEGVNIKIRGKQLLTIGVVSKKFRKMFDIKAEIYFLDMNFEVFLDIIKSNSLTVNELSKFPEVRRDLALLVDKNVTFTELRSVALKVEKKMLKNVTLFDIYEGDKVPEGKKSLALNFVLEDTTKTLTDSVIDKCMSALIYQFEKLGATIRK